LYDIESVEEGMEAGRGRRGAWWWWLVVRLSLRVKIGKQRTWMTEKEQVRS
jgi:hypothetical protein